MIRIYDNAGDHEDDFPRLVSIGKTKESADLQLSMYGMGMKRLLCGWEILLK